MSHPHLLDERLIELCLGGSDPARDEQHLASCAACAARRAAIVQMLDAVDQAATLEADAAFPPEKLARQQARILQRLEQDGRPGRVIAFPAARPPQPAAPHQVRPATRWVAAAGAAGLVVGLLAGHLAHDLPAARQAQQAHTTSHPSSAQSLVLSSEEEFLSQIQVAVERGGPAVLLPLDALTPLPWDAR